MTTKVQKWGNSQGLRIARHVLEEAKIDIGDDVNVVVRDGQIVISPVRRTHGKLDLKELVSRIPHSYKAGEMDWGKPAGKEVW